MTQYYELRITSGFGLQYSRRPQQRCKAFVGGCQPRSVFISVDAYAGRNVLLRLYTGRLRECVCGPGWLVYLAIYTGNVNKSGGTAR